jgi:hypothetical protein
MPQFESQQLCAYEDPPAMLITGAEVFRREAHIRPANHHTTVRAYEDTDRDGNRRFVLCTSLAPAALMAVAEFRVFLDGFGISLNCKFGTDKAARHGGYRAAQPSAPTAPVGTCRHLEVPVGTCRHRRRYLHYRQSTRTGNTPAMMVPAVPAGYRLPAPIRHNFRFPVGYKFGSISAATGPDVGSIASYTSALPMH